MSTVDDVMAKLKQIREGGEVESMTPLTQTEQVTMQSIPELNKLIRRVDVKIEKNDFDERFPQENIETLETIRQRSIETTLGNASLIKRRYQEILVSME